MITPVPHQIDYTSERHTGHWICHDCDARGESREALVLAARHTRTTGHKAQAASTSKVIYHPTGWTPTEAPPKAELGEPQQTEDEKQLLAAVIANPRKRHFEYADLVRFSGKRLDRARDGLLGAGLIEVVKQSTGGGPRKVLVPAQSANAGAVAA